MSFEFRIQHPDVFKLCKLDLMLALPLNTSFEFNSMGSKLRILSLVVNVKGFTSSLSQFSSFDLNREFTFRFYICIFIGSYE